MRKVWDQYGRYLTGLAAAICVVVLGLSLLRPGAVKNGESGEQIESELGGQGQDGDVSEPGSIENAPIRVLLMTSGYDSTFHSSVSLSAEGGLLLTYGGQREEWNSGILTLPPDDDRLKNGRVVAEPLDGASEIRVESINRGRGIPSYEGKIEIWSGEEGMAVINELPLECYLCRVVPSEMPSSYETEALKAQAVCARSYAVRQMREYAYPEYQAHINDSVAYQVYNNSYPAESANLAVQETAGEVVWYQGEVAVTYYFSTSCGKTTDMEAWGSVRNESQGYLQGIRVCDETGDYEADFPWYRWTATLTASCMQGLLESYSGKQLGTLQTVEVTRRGAGDVALEVTAQGSEETVVIATENKIRTALGGSGYQIAKQDGQVVDSQTLLPSAFISIERTGEMYVIRGGGYGHGIGMSQNGANEMAKDGKTYAEILKFFYQGVEIQ